MTSKTYSAVAAGITLGVVFVAIAMIPYSRWYPLVLPLLGGALATYLASRNAFVTSGEGFKLGAATGVVAGLIVVFVGAPLTYLIVSFFLRGLIGEAEASRGFFAVLVAMTIPAALVLVLSIVGAVAAVPLLRRARV